MGYSTPDFPNSIWDGLSPNSFRTSRSDTIDPNAKDWDQIVSEMIAVQEAITVLGGGPNLNENTWSVTAGEDLNDGDFVLISEDGTLERTNATTSYLVAGIAIETKLEGQLTKMITQGRYTNINWVLTPGRDYYLREGGTISLEPPEMGWVIPVGRAIIPQGLDINIKQPIRL